MSPFRLNIDRSDNPLGKHQRPLLKAAMPNPPQQKTASITVQDSHPTDKAERRRDSTENPSFSKKELVSHTAKLFLSWLTGMVPNRTHLQTSSQIWECVLSALNGNDFESARKSMLNLNKHPSNSRTAFVNRRRALSILAVLVAVDEWSAKTPLSSQNSQLLSAGIAHGSPDAIAFGSWFYLKERWNSSPVPFEEMGLLLVRAARHGHGACQAVLGIMLSPLSKLSSWYRRKLLTTNELGAEHEHLNRQTSQPKLHGQAKRKTVQKHDVRRSLETRLNQDVQMLKEAASRGFFLAIDHLEREAKKRRLNSGKRRNNEYSCLTTREQRVSAQEFFYCVQNAANQQIPYCTVKLAELLQTGIGCQKNEDDARLWLQTAANLNVPVAMREVHANAKTENQRVTATLTKRKSPEREFRERNSFAEEHRANAILKRNFILQQRYEERISRWQEEQEKRKRVLAFHVIGNLSSKISENMSSAVLQFLFEREKEGWL